MRRHVISFSETRIIVGKTLLDEARMDMEPAQ